MDKFSPEILELIFQYIKPEEDNLFNMSIILTCKKWAECYFNSRRVLDLRQMDEESIPKLETWVKKHEYIETIRLCSQRLRSEGSTALTHLPSTIKVIDFRGVTFGSKTNKNMIIGKINQLTNIEHINLCLTGLNPEGAIALSKTFVNLPNLKYLDINANNIGISGTKAIAESFQHIPQLEYIDIGHNNIGQFGVEAIAERLNLLPNLRTLQIESNDFDSEGSGVLFESLKGIPNLTHLNIGGNVITQKGLLDLAEAIEFLPELLILDIHATVARRYPDDGTAAVVTALTHTPKLQVLNVYKCCSNYYSRAIGIICEQLGSLVDIKKLVMGDISPKQFDQLKESLPKRWDFSFVFR
eukprot:TRINITY_DN192_c0_g1_i1.p1 TRINITY_DN192_c0_g1~~TRINITY_DN192_c0_g1_i1.p1  ORF type:complete len:356 (-),score=96.99 TRINITY_DN192_c0_g1_i1:98-1165(-)